MKYKTAMHSGGLNECLNSERNINAKYAEILIRNGIYKYYCYDSRINAKRYLLVDMENNPGLPTWINEYED